MAVRITTDYDDEEQELLNILESTYSTDTATSTITRLNRLSDVKWKSVDSLTALATEIAARENLPGYGIDTDLYDSWLELLYADDKIAQGYTDADLVATAQSILKRSDYSRYSYIYRERKPFMDKVSEANAEEEAARAHVFGRIKRSGTSTDTTKTDSTGATTLSTSKDTTTTEDGTSAATTPEGSSGTTIKNNAGVSTSGLTRVFSDGKSPYDPALLDKRPAWMDTNIEYHRTKNGTSFLVDSAIIKRYYSVIDAEVYFGNEYVEDIHDINWVINQNVLPLFGYNSYTYDEIARGNRLISGNFTINFTSPNYLFAILEAANSATTSTITSLEDYTVPVLTAGSEITYRKNTLGSKISGHHAVMWPQTFDIDIIFGENSAAGKPVHIILTGCALQACQQILSASATGSPPVVMEQYSFIGQDIRTVVTSAIGVSKVTDAGTVATDSVNSAAKATDTAIDTVGSSPIVTLVGSGDSPNNTLIGANGDYTITGGNNAVPTIGSGSSDGRVLTLPKVYSSNRYFRDDYDDDGDDNSASNRNRIRNAADTSTYKAPATDTTVTPTDTTVNIALTNSNPAYLTITDPNICRLLNKLKDSKGVGLSPEEQQTLGDYLNRTKGQTINNDGVYSFNYQDPNTGEVSAFTVDDPTIATIAAGKLPYQAEDQEPTVFTIDDSASCLALSRLLVQKLPPDKQKSLGNYINVCKQATYTTEDSEGNPVYHFKWIKPANSYTGLSEPIEESFECSDYQIAQLMSGGYPYNLDESIYDDDRLYEFLDEDICNLMAIWQSAENPTDYGKLTKQEQETLGTALDAYKLQTYYVAIDDPAITAWVGEQDYYVYYYYLYPKTQERTLFKITYSSIKGLMSSIFPYYGKEGSIPDNAKVHYIIMTNICTYLAKVQKNPCGLNIKEQKTLGNHLQTILDNTSDYYWDGSAINKIYYFYYKHPDTEEKTLFSVSEDIIRSWCEGSIDYNPNYTGTQYLGRSAPDTDFPDFSEWPHITNKVICRLLDRWLQNNVETWPNLTEQKTLATHLDGIKSGKASEAVVVYGNNDTKYYFSYESEYYNVEYQTCTFLASTLNSMISQDTTNDEGYLHVLGEDTTFYVITDKWICKYLDDYINNAEGLTKDTQKRLATYFDSVLSKTYRDQSFNYYFYYRSTAFNNNFQIFILTSIRLDSWRNQRMPYNPTESKVPEEFAKYVPNGKYHEIPVGNLVTLSDGTTIRYDGVETADKDIHYATITYTQAPEPIPTALQLLNVCVEKSAVTYTEGAAYDATYYKYNEDKCFKLSYYQTYTE